MHTRNFSSVLADLPPAFIHPLSVQRELAKWPEHGQRERKWFSIKQAPQPVASNELKRIILDLKARLPRD